jgi:chromosome segregation ATPase
MPRPSTKGGGHLKGTPTKDGRSKLQERAEKRAKAQKKARKDAQRRQAQKDQEAQITTEEKYEKLTKDYASLETAYVGLQAGLQAEYEISKKYKKMHAGLAKDHAKLEYQFEDLSETCNILLKSKEACKKEVAELIGKNNALLQNITKLTVTNDALITLVTKLDPRQRSLQESPSKKNDPDEKSSWKVRDEARQDRLKALPRKLDRTFAQVAQGKSKKESKKESKKN